MGRIAALVAVAALGLTACGGNGGGGASGGTTPDTASFAPASAAFFVSIDTDFNGEQWKKAKALLDKFPSRDKLVQQLEQSLAQEKVDFERDIKPALGPEVGIAGFDLTADNPPFVVYTKSPSPEKLKALLAKGDEPVVTREVLGWTLAAETKAELDRFASERPRGSLAEAADFQDAIASVDTDGAVLGYIAGSGIQSAIDQGLRGEGAPAGLSEKLGTLQSIAFSASVQDDGVSFDESTTLGSDLGLKTYSPALDGEVPAKALFFLSVSNLDTLTRKGLAAAEKSIPNFAEQRAQFEQALGFSVEDDLLPLLSGEVALAIYGEASGTLPVTVDVLLAVDDEANARRLMDRFGALLALGDTGTAKKVQIGDTQATELHFTDENFSVFWLVKDGKLEISTSRAGLEALRASTPRLADDAAYTAALASADSPDKVVALVYSDLQAAVPFLSALDGSAVDAETRANLKELTSVVASVTADGDSLHVSGFLGIG